jgi:L-fuconate dehydratase
MNFPQRQREQAPDGILVSQVFKALETFDVRFATSRHFHGSDAMNPDPDYSAAYVTLRTDSRDGHEGNGFAFTIGRGNEVQTAAVRALAPLVVGRDVDEVFGDMGAFWRGLCGDSQLRWLGPDKGVTQMAIAAVVNAAWDLYAKREGKPLWKLLADMSPERIVSLLDFRYLDDAITEREALALLQEVHDGKIVREVRIVRDGYPAYTTSAGWIGYSDELIRERCRRAVEEGWRYVKLKVGRDIGEDARRCRIAREIIGPNRKLMVDANQSWNVAEAIENIKVLAQFDPWWIEEPTHPDDLLGLAAIAKAVAPIQIAAGEHVPNRVVFKQLLQSGAIGFCQVDACRSGGVNDVIATLLVAAKHGVPVCPHAGGVGLCELAQHISIFDYVAVSGSLWNRVIEYVDHLHEHFVDPVVVKNGHYVVPMKPGFSTTIFPKTLDRYAFPNGPEWQTLGVAAT